MPNKPRNVAIFNWFANWSALVNPGTAHCPPTITTTTSTSNNVRLELSMAFIPVSSR